MSNVLSQPISISVHSYKNVMFDLLQLMGFTASNYFSEIDIENYFDKIFLQKVICGNAIDGTNKYDASFKDGVMTVYCKDILIATVYKYGDEEDIYYTNQLEDLIDGIYIDIIKISKRWYKTAFSRYSTSSHSAVYLAYSEYCHTTIQEESEHIEKYFNGVIIK